ncbi:MAG: hypothetical protein MZU97_10240 [Bacillus subtilis]|nr:hypothetical protein [Bacillus subtilis]
MEGTHDKQKLESIYPGVECIVTNGSEIADTTIALIKNAAAVRGVILFLDPDHPGRMSHRPDSVRRSGCEDRLSAKTRGDQSKRPQGRRRARFRGSDRRRAQRNLYGQRTSARNDHGSGSVCQKSFRNARCRKKARAAGGSARIAGIERQNAS